MQKMIVKLSRIILSLMLLYSFIFQAKIAYIPQILREYVRTIKDVAGSVHDIKNLQELCAMFEENRILASDITTRKALQEALEVMQAYKNEWKEVKQYESVKSYIQDY